MIHGRVNEINGQRYAIIKLTITEVNNISKRVVAINSGRNAQAATVGEIAAKSTLFLKDTNA